MHVVSAPCGTTLPALVNMIAYGCGGTQLLHIPYVKGFLLLLSVGFPTSYYPLVQSLINFSLSEPSNAQIIQAKSKFKAAP